MGVIGAVVGGRGVGVEVGVVEAASFFVLLLVVVVVMVLS